jgi:hypothetical protein
MPALEGTNEGIIFAGSERQLDVNKGELGTRPRGPGSYNVSYNHHGEPNMLGQNGRNSSLFFIFAPLLLLK